MTRVALKLELRGERVSVTASEMRNSFERSFATWTVVGTSMADSRVSGRYEHVRHGKSQGSWGLQYAEQHRTGELAVTADREEQRWQVLPCPKCVRQ